MIQRRTLANAARTALVACMGAVAGCPFSPIGGGGGNSTVPIPADTFGSAPNFPRVEDTVTYQFSVTRGGVHVWKLGSLSAGDRIIVTVEALTSSPLDPTVAIFDDNMELFTLNDDVDLNAGRLDSRIDEVIRADGDSYFLAIAPSFFGDSAGAYEASVRIISGGGPPDLDDQVVFLNFAGGIVSIPGVGSFDVPEFDAARVDVSYAGTTNTMRTIIVNTVDDRFSGLGLTILNSADDARPTGEFSEVFFGEFNSRAFGVSESVDHWNRDRSDNSIVFTDDFDNPFAGKPAADEIAVAIGNVAAHEIGHLLGMEHTADVTELMDTTGTASTLLEEQVFKRAVLDASVFPIGFQNSIELLGQLVGMTGSGAGRVILVDGIDAPSDAPSDAPAIQADPGSSRHWCLTCAGRK